MSTHISSTRAALRPGTPAFSLSVPIVGGGAFVLAERHAEQFTVIVCYRGLQFPVCRNYLRDVEGKLTDFSRRGVDVIAGEF